MRSRKYNTRQITRLYLFLISIGTNLDVDLTFFIRGKRTLNIHASTLQFFISEN